MRIKFDILFASFEFANHEDAIRRIILCWE